MGIKKMTADLPGWLSGRGLCRFPTLGKEHVQHKHYFYYLSRC